LFGCGAKKVATNKKNSVAVIKEQKPENLPSVDENKIIRKLAKENPRLNHETLAYIKKYAAIAVNEMHRYKIPASITLAQGILESGSGKSVLALKSNNHFGIKCHAQWTGDKVYHDDDEKGECFRKYLYPESSYNDHSLFLTQRRRYAFLFDYDIGNYKRWAYGLRKAGYATDKKYPAKLLILIKNYELYEFDKMKKRQLRNDEKEIVVQGNAEKSEANSATDNQSYLVKKGDTLYSISRKFQTTVRILKDLNGLKSNDLSIHQVLIINN
jgi:flagellum-specific peptidoglycan hydrolase FlgJ